MKVFGVVPAAGIGRRFGSKIPKQYQQLAGKTILEHSILRLQAGADLESIRVALHETDQYWPMLSDEIRQSVQVVSGGAQRSDSVRLAMASITNAQPDDCVLVHDAVRPLLDPKKVAELIETLSAGEPGAILAIPVHDTIKQAGADQSIDKTLDRSALWAAQTPQVFRFGLLKEALDSTQGDDQITDEASAMEACGHRVRLYEGHRSNIKITCQEDLALAEYLIKMTSAQMKTATGQ